MKLLFAESDFWSDNPDFKARYKDVVTTAYHDAKKVLKLIPDQLTIVCQANTWECIVETGEGGFTRSSRLVLLSLDPSLPYGEEKLLAHVRSTVFHELSHVARFEQGIWHTTILESAIMEGLATVFERDYAKSDPLWGGYSAQEAKKWVQEMYEAGKDTDWNAWLYQHPDGRRWIAYKTGTWIVDEALRHSKKSLQALTDMPSSEIIKLSGAL